MRKKIGLTILSIATFICATNAVNATEYSSSDWLTDGGNYGSAVADANDSNITTMKGNATSHEGPYSKKSTEKLVDGITEDFNVMLDPSEFAQAELFETRVRLNDEAGEAVNEFGVMVQKDGDVFKITSGINGNFAVTISNKGVYTFRHEAFIENGEAYCKITVLQGNNVLGSTDKVLLNDITHLITIDDSNIDGIVVRNVWYCNIQVNNGIDVYTKLPTVNVTFVDPTDEEDTVLEFYKYMAFTEDELNEFKTSLVDAAREEGYNFEGFYLDEDYTDEADLTIPFEEDTTIYLKATKLAEENADTNTSDVLPPKTSDINLIATISMIVLSVCGVVFVLNKRFAKSH